MLVKVVEVSNYWWRVSSHHYESEKVLIRNVPEVSSTLSANLCLYKLLKMIAEMSLVRDSPRTTQTVHMRINISQKVLLHLRCEVQFFRQWRDCTAAK